MFQVRITTVGFLGDSATYPCHMKHEIGDEVIFDGESYHGRLCPSVWPLVVPKVEALHQAGPRYVDWKAYFPFWYCPVSVADPAGEPTDGLGFRNVLETLTPPPYHMARLSPPGGFLWPPNDQGGVMREPSVMCPDLRTAVVFELEAFDLSEKGFDTPYFRRQMAILQKLRQHGPTPRDGILGLFTKEEIEGIYPAIGAVATAMLTEELELLDYAATGADGVTAITPKGEAKLENFLAGLPPDHRAMLGW
jgi:uncharacterized repeat protein (TIGR04076 family)